LCPGNAKGISISKILFKKEKKPKISQNVFFSFFLSLLYCSIIFYLGKVESYFRLKYANYGDVFVVEKIFAKGVEISPLSLI